MLFKKPILSLIVAGFILYILHQPLSAQSSLDDNAVIKLVKAGLSEALIVSTISSQPGTYDTSTDGLIALKQAGVSDKVVGAIIAKSATPASVADSTPRGASTPLAFNFDDPTQVHAPGIYIFTEGRDGHTHLTKLEHVVPKQAKTSGMFTSAITYGVVKAHIKAVVDGSRAAVQTSDSNPTFYTYIPEDNSTFGGSSISIKDFAMIKFDVKGQQREINTASVTIWSASGGVDEKSRQAFTTEAVRPGIYKIALTRPLPVGEYAFQQSGTQGSAADQKNTGSYFDFGIVADR